MMTQSLFSELTTEMGCREIPRFFMYFLTFFSNGEYCFQVAEMTTPCRFGLDEVDLLVEINTDDPNEQSDDAQNDAPF